MSALRLLSMRPLVVRAVLRMPAAAAAAAVSGRPALPCAVRAAAAPLGSSLRSMHSSCVRLSVDPTAPPAPLDASEVTSRVLSVIRKFEKVDPAKVSETAAFARDLGLDSLDGVEVTMALEDEFGIEIPDADADKIQSVADAINYIKGNSKAH